MFLILIFINFSSPVRNLNTKIEVSKRNSVDMSTLRACNNSMESIEGEDCRSLHSPSNTIVDESLTSEYDINNDILLTKKNLNKSDSKKSGFYAKRWYFYNLYVFLEFLTFDQCFFSILNHLSLYI